MHTSVMRPRGYKLPHALGCTFAPGILDRSRFPSRFPLLARSRPYISNRKLQAATRISAIVLGSAHGSASPASVVSSWICVAEWKAHLFPVSSARCSRRESRASLQRMIASIRDGMEFRKAAGSSFGNCAVKCTCVAE